MTWPSLQLCMPLTGKRYTFDRNAASKPRVPPTGGMADRDPNCGEDVRSFRRILRLRLSDLSNLICEAASDWSNDNAPRLGASLAFYTLLSLAPLLVIVVAVAAMIFGRDAAEGQLAWEIQGLVGRDVAAAIQALIRGAIRPEAGVLATLLSVLTLAVGATTVVAELRDALDIIWKVPANHSETVLKGIVSQLKQRFYCFVLILGVGFLLLVSLVLNVWIAAAGKMFGSVLQLPESILQVITSLVSLVIITFLFAAIYKIVPQVNLHWADVLIGAAVTSVTFTAGKQLIGLYLG